MKFQVTNWLQVLYIFLLLVVQAYNFLVYCNQAEELLRAKHDELRKELLDIKIKCSALEDKLAEAESEREVQNITVLIHTFHKPQSSFPFYHAMLLLRTKSRYKCFLKWCKIRAIALGLNPLTQGYKVYALPPLSISYQHHIYRSYFVNFLTDVWKWGVCT